jgi:hypothetical protein
MSSYTSGNSHLFSKCFIRYSVSLCSSCHWSDRCHVWSFHFPHPLSL